MKWAFEDFKEGMRIEVGSCAISQEEIIAFATRYDPQPFHIDPAAAEQTIFGGIIASGWQTCGIMMRLMVDHLLRDSTSMGSPGVDEVRWLKPVRAGDTLTVAGQILELRPSASKPDRGVVHIRWEARNQHDEPVASFKGMGMFGRRAA